METDTHDELLAQKGLYRHLYVSQFKGKEVLRGKLVFGDTKPKKGTPFTVPTRESKE